MNKIRRPITHFFCSIFTALFGRVNWSRPQWLAYLQQKAKNSPKTFWFSTCLIILFIAASVCGVIWYKNLPKPILIAAKITVPDITPNEETLVPNALVMDFGLKSNNDEFINQSVAPIQLINKEIKQGIEMSPKVKGHWVWTSDSQLTFSPEEDWPADQKYTISFAKEAFAANAKLESHDFHFKTKAFKASISEFKFYQDPVNPDVRRAVATIQFNYPVDPENLVKNTNLSFQALKKGDLDLKAEPVHFSYTYDPHKRVAYLQSDNIKIASVERYLLLNLNKDLSSATGSGKLKKEESHNLLIPDSSNFLKVISASASIIKNEKDRPEQVLTVETSIGIKDNDFNRSVHVYLLPTNRPVSSNEPERVNYRWQTPGEINGAVLNRSVPLTKEAIPTDHNYATLHSFKFKTQTPRYLYVKIDKGMKGFGGFELKNSYETVIEVPPYPQEISFLHKGSLLALSGEKKLSVLVRGMEAVKFDFARILPENINQLVTQTRGDFNNPYFFNPTFNQQNISQITTDIQKFDASDLTKQQYTALDLGKYLSANANASGPQGLFLVQAHGWDTQRNVALPVKSSRLVLITDLGLVVKDNQDGSHDVFVQSITSGTPASAVTVTVLGKNGLPILSRSTDAQGHVNFPSLKDFIEEREPTVYLAKLGDDVSFIPYANSTRQLNFSKFDVGGLYTNEDESKSLTAFIFTDRGIYRPGDQVNLGFIVKQAYAQSQTAGLPLQVTITDPRGTTVKDQKMTLSDSGYMEINLPTQGNFSTGQYTVNLFLVKDNLAQNNLGSASFRVEEFQPDRMRISAYLNPKPTDGWTSPAGLKAEVDLWNLYGAPATDRRISGKILLIPRAIEFNQFPDYVFADPLLDPKKPAKVFNDTLTDVKTNSKGQAVFDLNLERFEKATYQLTFFAEGFEAEGGRSVTSQVKTFISPLPYFVGYKPDGDLSFIKQNTDRSVNYIAVNPQLSKEEIKDLTLELVSLHPVTSLVKKADSTYQYQSVIQSNTVSKNPLSILEQGSDYKLPTANIGDFLINVLDKNGVVLSQVKFTVVGASQTPLAKNAELNVQLDKKEYRPNEKIQLQITAPYTGSGLITIERDKVYASQWFKTDTTNTLQSIEVPADFKGNGYVNVAFVRDWESPEIFTSPLSYSVMPFQVNHDNQAIEIDLKSKTLLKPGENLTIQYQTNKPSKIVVFAVDEGILQVSHYKTPNPLAFFFQKHALEVFTQQTVDQILPKFIQDREISAAGGDGGENDLAGRLNPFKRKTDLPVVYWSGILDADSTSRELTYKVPDYFNGKIRIMAVAVSNDSLGSKETATEVRGDFIINPNVPTFVAPGDEFEISASVANNLKDSGDHAPITVALTAASELEIIDKPQQSLEISEGHEQTVRFKVRAKNKLGASKITFKASSGDKVGQMDSTLSVRPANPFVTHLNTGYFNDKKKEASLIQTLYPEYRQASATLSDSPLILVTGLQRYLDNYPYGCTEQLTTKALPLLAMYKQSWFQKDLPVMEEKINKTIQMLSQRQMSNGGFSYWPGLAANQGNDFASVYAMQFLTEAKAQGFTVPNDLFARGLSYLKDLAGQNATDLNTARIQAYAIYVLTRNELVTSNYITNLQLFLQKDKNLQWQSDITGSYLAASYQLLKSDQEADQLIGQFKTQWDAKDKQSVHTDFYGQSIANAQYLYLIAKHFPKRLNQVGNPLLMQLIQSINDDEINTVLFGYTSLALGAYPQANAIEAPQMLSMTELLADNQQKQLPADNANYQKVNLDLLGKQIAFNNPDKRNLFYQVVQAGFDKTIPTEPIKQGIEVFKEFRDANGNVINSVVLGNELEVHIQIRALDGAFHSNVVIEDLLPGGFEVVLDSVRNEGLDYADAREDRVNFFGNVDSTARQIVYKIKATNTGKFQVPPVFAEAMYNAKTKARGVPSTLTVTKRP